MRIIPKNKIKGLRFGQLLINALLRAKHIQQFSGDNIQPSYIVKDIDPFYIENDELEEIIQEFLNEKDT